MGDEASNARFIAAEAAWFEHSLLARLRAHAEDAPYNIADIVRDAPPLPPPGVPYGDVIRAAGFGPAERLLLMLAFLPHLRPAALDPLLIRSDALQRPFTEFGGLIGGDYAGFLPSQETALFLLAGNDLEARLGAMVLFAAGHPLQRHRILQPPPEGRSGPPVALPLRLDPECLDRLLTGGIRPPAFSMEFPAQHVTTPYEWPDLVLEGTALGEIEDILAWQQHERTLMRDWQLERRLKPGYRALFHGPSGTGKTLTACLIGKKTGQSVYRTDLSKVVSKWIGETEKNLAALFDRAEHSGMILFFDEADSLFGKRGETRSANDRFANQQIAYLLQRIEDFPGLVILASNLRGNIDEAFSRRFESMVAFPMPNAEQRLRLWEGNFHDKPYQLEKNVDLKKLARDHEMSGGSIVNVLRYACLKAVGRKPPEQMIRHEDLVAGVRREMRKEGKFVG